MSQLKPLTLPPEIQQIFDDLLAFMGSTYPQCNVYGTYSGTGTNLGISATDVTGFQVTYSEFEPGPRITVAPPNVTLGPGQQQQFTATATNPDGTPFKPVPPPTFTFTVMPGASGTITTAGLYTAPAAISAPTADSIRCQITGQMAWTSFSVSLAVAK